jgi:hypothetical protein
MTDENIYKNSKIYTIRYKNDNSLIYVGSTIQPLNKRWSIHKSSSSNSKYQGPLYKKIRETNNIDDWYIELYEDYPCERKELLLQREGQIITEIGTLNKIINGRTKKESDKLYTDKNKDIIAVKKKIYRKANNDKIKAYEENRKESRKEYTKEYYKNNKEYYKEYYKNNKEYYNKTKENRKKNINDVKTIYT